MPLRSSVASAAPNGAASVDGQPAWWVGSAGEAPLIAKWRKGAWRLSAQPWTKQGALNAVSGSSSTNAWSVGYLNPAAPKPISAHWNGTSWTKVAVPNAGGQIALVDVVALPSGAAWAVGSRLSGSRTTPFVVQNMGSGWVNSSPAIDEADEGALTAVAVDPEGTIWAAGWRTANGASSPWIIHWDGHSWEDVATDSYGFGYLTDLAFGAGHAFAAGYMELPSGGYGPLLLQRTAGTWASAALPWGSQSSVLVRAMTVMPSGMPAIAGTQLEPLPKALMSWSSDTGWQSRRPGNATFPGGWMRGIAATASGAFAVGSIATKARVFTTCGAGSTAALGQSVPQALTAARPSGDVLSDPSVAVPRPNTARGGARLAAATPVTATDVTKSANIAISSKTFGGVAADFNGDGWTDVFVNRHNTDVPLLELGGPQGFSTAAATFDFADRHGCAAADTDGNGKIDLFCSEGKRRGNLLAGHEFLLDVGDDGGAIATQEWGLEDVSGRGRATVFVHLAGHSHPALFVINEPARMDGLPSMNRFYLNAGGTHFEPAPQLGLDTSAGGTCVAAADLDGDGNDEIILCSTDSSGGLPSGIRVYGYNGTRFVDRTAALGLEPFGEATIRVADFDGDGVPDLARSRANNLVVSLQRNGGFADSFTLATSHIRTIAVGDVNADGLADIYLRANNSHSMLVNDGDGAAFSAMALPPVIAGSADDVLTLDYDNNGFADFLTFNGRYSVHSLQLIAFAPSAPQGAAARAGDR